MSKMKTSRALAKRLRVRKSGSMKRKYAFHSHILTKKTTKRCRHLRQRAAVDPGNLEAAKKMMPYS